MSDAVPEGACCQGLIKLDKDTAVALADINRKIDEREHDRERERDRLDELAHAVTGGFDELKKHVSTCIDSQDAKRREDIQKVHERIDNLKNLFLAAGLTLLAGLIVAFIRG